MLPVPGGGPSTLELLLEAVSKVVGVAGGPQQCQGWGADVTVSWRRSLLPWVALSVPGSVCPAVQTQLLLTP